VGYVSSHIAWSKPMACQLCLSAYCTSNESVNLLVILPCPL